MVVFFSSVLGLPAPLSPLHLLWVNLVTDGPPATGLGFNPPDKLCMTRPPRPRHDSLLTPWLLMRYLLTGSYVGVAAITAYIQWFRDRGISFAQLRNNPVTEMIAASSYLTTDGTISGNGLAYPQSLALSVLVVIELLKAISAVSLHQSLFIVPPWKNSFLLLSVAVSFGLHLTLLETPFLSKIFGLHRLTMKDWRAVLVLALPVLLLEELLKFIGRSIHHHNHHHSTDSTTTTSTRSTSRK
jgi:Ca2+-transporting ATPase